MYPLSEWNQDYPEEACSVLVANTTDATPHRDHQSELHLPKAPSTPTLYLPFPLVPGTEHTKELTSLG